ncbi:hypothetical protein PL9631_1020095 [Planktothrix paucivesiculata PCC 9631]|uniref:Uncharacterized protein n=1 Tax=Planktothrix paucivesiculata PCC 9631 TaxID=671071 RepID=A0A7Z9DUR2_9CYAN|nr:hypothetical protein PL9631_1020095 [Planktothrix paucivesiculata PCC 9631]
MGRCSPVIRSMIEKIPSSVINTPKNIIKQANINNILISKTYLLKINAETRTGKEPLANPIKMPSSSKIGIVVCITTTGY